MNYPIVTMVLGAAIFAMGLYCKIWPAADVPKGAKAEVASPGPNFNFHGPSTNQFNMPAPPAAVEEDSIYQAGVSVGKAFGARRSPSDATIFEFSEITNCGQFNTGAPFTYKGVKLRFVSERNSALMDISRVKDSPIRYGVLARVSD
jgi:hypothetical protein